MKNFAQVGNVHAALIVGLVIFGVAGLYIVKNSPNIINKTEAAKPQSTTSKGSFSQLTADLRSDKAIFQFLYSTITTSYIVDISLSPNMKQSVYREFGKGPSSPVVVFDPQNKWDKYTCGTTIYWVVRTVKPRVDSEVQQAVVNCAPSGGGGGGNPTPTPTPTPGGGGTVSPTPTATPAPRSSFWVKSYLVYPADKSMYPEYETAVNNYLVELQNWYQEKVGVTFFLQPLVVVRSSYDYVTMRCDPDPSDSTPPSDACISNPAVLEGDWSMYMNLAIHNGSNQWESQTAALIFGAGGGGYAGGYQLSGYAGRAIVGDWVLEPISGVVNSWGMPCSLSDGWQCSGGVPKGTPAHELGHGFGLGHPDPMLYPDPSIMKWHGDYPTVGFLPHEVDFLKQSPFFN